MAIHAYDFTTGDLRNTVAYFKQFLSLMVRDLTNPTTIDFFSSVTDVRGDPTEPGGGTWTINCYTSGGVDDSVPALQFIFRDLVTTIYSTIGFRMRFNGKRSWEYAYTARTSAVDVYVPNEYYIFDSELEEYILVTSESVPDDWETEYQKYYQRRIDSWADEYTWGEWDPATAKPRYGFLTSKGALIINEGGQALVISKTNNGDLSITYPGKDSRLASCYNIGADGDTIRPDSATMFGFCDSTDHITVDMLNPPLSQQTVMTPVSTNRTDIASYLDGVYVLPQSQFRQKGIIEVGSVRYATNGYFALEE